MASSNMPERSYKKQKLREDEDIISNLPESILVQILSCLSTKDAVRTCVLSKRWLFLWTFITKLHFNDFELHSKKKKRKKCFVDFVSRVLLHLNNSSLQSFSLNVGNECDSSLINAWISAVLHRSVKELMIYYHPLNSNSNSSLAILCSNSLFSCKSLVKLVLHFNLRCTVRLPAFVHLPNLKALQLLNVEFRSDSSSNPKEQTLSFPILEKFECKYCVWYDVQIVSLQVPLLETVVVKCRSYHSLPYDHPLSYDRDEPFDHPWPFNHPDCIIKLCASRLREFTYVGAVSQEYILSDPSLAPNVSAILVFPDEIDVRTCKLIKQFNHVKYLNLDAFQVSAEAIGSFLNLPAFIMLRHLDLGCVGGDMLMDLLPKTPNLTTLEIEGIDELDEELLDSAIVPHCLSDSLKEFYLGRVSGKEDQFRLAKYVMENGLVLERLSFSPTCTLQESKRELNKVKKKLLSFKKGSNLAIIEFPICKGCD